VRRSVVPVRLEVPNAQPLRPTPSLLIEREIVRALVQCGAVVPRDAHERELLRSWMEVFPGRLSTAAEAAGLEVLEADVFGYAAGFSKVALDVGAAAKARPADAPHQRTRLSDLPIGPISPEQHTEAIAHVARAFDDPTTLQGLAAFLPPGGIEELKVEVQRIMRTIVDRQAAVGPQQAVAEMLDALRDGRAPRRHLDTLRHEHSFRTSVQAVLTNVFGVADATVLAEVARSITLADCPGTWLRAAVELEVTRAEPAPPASADHDVGHIGFLPHVDVLLADKRVAQYATQVLRQADCPDSLCGCVPPSRASTLPGILRAIRARASMAGKSGDAR